MNDEDLLKEIRKVINGGRASRAQLLHLRSLLKKKQELALKIVGKTEAMLYAIEVEIKKT